jgi:hypothetical protein
MRITNITKWKVNILLLMALLFGITIATHAQVTIGSGIAPDPDALLDLKENSAGTATKGLLLPRVALNATDDEFPLSVHVKGMVVYNTTPNGTGATAVTEGFYYNDGTRWVKAGSDGTGGDGSGDYRDDIWEAKTNWTILEQESLRLGRIVCFVVRLKSDINQNAWNNTKLEIAKLTDVGYAPANQTGLVGCHVYFDAPSRASVSTTAECFLNNKDFEGTMYFMNMRESVGTILNKATIQANEEIVVSGTYFVELPVS